MATILFTCAMPKLSAFDKQTLFAYALMQIPSFCTKVMGKEIEFRARFDLFTTRTLFMCIVSIMNTMRFSVFRSTGHKLKVGKHVVAWVFINVVDGFIRLKFSTKVLFHDVAMLKHSFASNTNDAISVWSGPSSSISWMVGTTKREGRAMTRTISLFPSVRFKLFATVFTEMFHNILNGINELKGYPLMPVIRRCL